MHRGPSLATNSRQLNPVSLTKMSYASCTLEATGVPSGVPHLTLTEDTCPLEVSSSYVMVAGTVMPVPSRDARPTVFRQGPSSGSGSNDDSFSPVSEMPTRGGGWYGRAGGSSFGGPRSNPAFSRATSKSVFGAQNARRGRGACDDARSGPAWYPVPKDARGSY